MGRLIFVGHFLQQSPMISGSFVNMSLSAKSNYMDMYIYTYRVAEMHGTP